jgi:putative endonuclease
VPISTLNQRTLKQRLGREGETLVAKYLTSLGFRITHRNAYVGHYEIDLIAVKQSLIVFCEVRSRSAKSIVHPAETIHQDKRRFIRQAAARWLQNQSSYWEDVRFDVACVRFETPAPIIDYYENAF